MSTYCLKCKKDKKTRFKSVKTKNGRTVLSSLFIIKIYEKTRIKKNTK